MKDKIAVIKVGWSDDYMGSAIEADHKHARQFKDGHEKYNFLPGPDGRFYAYTPPVGKYEVAPQPRELGGWLVFVVAKRPKAGGLYLMGWYEDASFEGAYLPRPEYKAKRTGLPLDFHGGKFSYTVWSDKAVQIDPLSTPHVFPGDHMKRSPIYYLRGNRATGAWRGKLAEKLLAIRRAYRPGKHKGLSPLRGGGRGGICADPARRKEVEEAAVALVVANYPKAKFNIEDCQKKKRCHFDLLVSRKDDPDDQLHIEVKGTQNDSPHFLISHGEYGYMRANPRHWRLAMVTKALSRKPILEIMTAAEAQSRFFWKEFCWHATAKP